MATPLLLAEDVAKSYGAVRALKSVDLRVLPGEAHALLGANGAGKSTFVKIVTGVVGLDHGSLSMEGEPLRLTDPQQGLARGIASVFQDPAMVPDLTVAENLILTGTPAAGVREHLERMGLGGLDLRERAGDVPLPFLRMLDLARALTHQPRLLILDEITAALPKDLADKVFAVVADLIAQDRSVLFISHRLEEVIEHCTMCTVFRDGRTVASFVPREGGEQRIVATMLGEAALATAERISAETAAIGDVRLSASGLSVVPDAAGIDLDVRAGEVVGVVALEGQGQDELFAALSGDRRPLAGTLSVDGSPLAAHHPADAIRRGVVLVPADRVKALLPQRPIRESIALPLRAPLRRWGPFSMATENRIIDRVIARLSIDTRAAAQAKRLSGGNQQKLTIGRWLAAGFRTLLLFDPTRGIDIGTKNQIYELVRELAADGAAVLMYTSELREVGLVCDRVLVLYQGSIVGGFPAEVDEETLLTAMHGLARAGGEVTP